MAAAPAAVAPGPPPSPSVAAAAAVGSAKIASCNTTAWESEVHMQVDKPFLMPIEEVR